LLQRRPASRLRRGCPLTRNLPNPILVMAAKGDSETGKPLLSQPQPTYDGRPADSRGTEAEASRVFPMEPFKCLPPVAKAFMPKQWQKIQCLAHLILVLGYATCIGLVIDTLASWYLHGCRTSYCQGRILPLFFVACCLMYFVRMIGQYDEDLLTKQKGIRQAKDALAKQYQETVAELDACIAKSMDAQAALAERTFDAKRRDFQRFLSKVVKDFKDAPAPSGQSDGGAFQEFRCFLAHWLKVFSECSIDPVGKPLQLASAEELSGCGTVTKVADLVAERLKATKVKFISEQLDQDKQELSGFRTVWSTLSQVHATVTAAKRKSLAPSAMSFTDPEGGTLSFDRGVMQDATKDEMSRRWLQPGRASQCCGVNRDGATENGFPFELHICRCKCIFLSEEHLQLMLAFIIGWLILYIEAFVVETAKWALQLNVSICLVCILFVLYEFVDLDLVQQLEGELKDVQAEQERLIEKRAMMKAFYDKAQQLADVWLHRTVPRLELLKQFSEEVEDLLTKGGCAEFLKDANAKFGLLEGSLPALPLWLAEETMDLKTKKLFGDAMTDLTRTSDVQASLKMIPQCSQTLALEAGTLQRAAQPKDSMAQG